MLPGAEGLRGPFTCLNEARYGILWGVTGAARDCYEAALRQATERRQFGQPIGSFQRALLGGDGVTLSHPVTRHMANLEAVATYEGTAEIHTLILGQALTGHSAFA
jgi:glutaryl-CoA dehydrogenase